MTATGQVLRLKQTSFRFIEVSFELNLSCKEITYSIRLGRSPAESLPVASATGSRCG